LRFDRDSLYDDFPVTDYYKGHIMDAVTIRRGGSWWSAILLIEDPKSSENFLTFYKWQKTDDGWKVRQRFKVNSRLEMEKINEILEEFKPNLS
jgi:hypothetical protein